VGIPRKQFVLLVFAIFEFGGVAQAGEQIRTPELKLDGSIPLQYSTNVTRSSQNRVSDWYISPYLKLSASGELLDDVRYSFYGSTGDDKYDRITSSDFSAATAGFDVKQRFGAFEVGGSIERNYFYDGIYNKQFDTANDFSLFLRYAYVNSAGTAKVRPSMAFTVRTGDDFSVKRDLFNFKVDFERKIADGWWVFLTPRLRVYDYVNRDSGRNDVISSASVGLRYDITKDISLTSGIGYESRTSGLSGHNYNGMIAGVSLDFSYALFKR
jgi:hypothetical protein